MKAHVRASVPERVLTYAIDESVEPQLSAALQTLAIEERQISTGELQQDVGYLAGFSGYEKKENAETVSLSCEGVMVMCGLSEARANALLKTLHEHNIRIPLKAMITPTNQNWSFVKLAEELTREHQAIKQGRRA